MNRNRRSRSNRGDFVVDVPNPFLRVFNHGPRIDVIDLTIQLFAAGLDQACKGIDPLYDIYSIDFHSFAGFHRTRSESSTTFQLTPLVNSPERKSCILHIWERDGPDRTYQRSGFVVLDFVKRLSLHEIAGSSSSSFALIVTNVTPPEKVPCMFTRRTNPLSRRAIDLIDFRREVGSPIDIRCIDRFDDKLLKLSLGIPVNLASTRCLAAWMRSKVSLSHKGPNFHRALLVRLIEIVLFSGEVGTRATSSARADTLVLATNMMQCTYNLRFQFHRPFHADEWMLVVIEAAPSRFASSSAISGVPLGGTARVWVFSRENASLVATGEEGAVSAIGVAHHSRV